MISSDLLRPFLTQKKMLTETQVFPQELIDAVAYLNEQNLQASNRNTDGRFNSIDDEKTIVKSLLEEYKENNVEAEDRKWFDHSLFNYYIQIKSSDVEKGASDNFNSKEAILYALTDMTVEEIDKVRSWPAFEHALLTRRCDYNDRDVYIFIMDKKSGRVYLNSLKSLNVLTANGNNLPFQIKWKENLTPVVRSGEEAYNFITSKYKESVEKKLNHHPLYNFL